MADATRLDGVLLSRRIAGQNMSNSGTVGLSRAPVAASRRTTLTSPRFTIRYDCRWPFIVMELVRGKTLASLLKDGPLSVERAIEIVSDVAEALGEAHRRGIIHRDIKPANVAISGKDKVKVLDFGLAKEIQPADADLLTQAGPALSGHTLPGLILGTPLYLSPEQAKGASVDARSDLFALGFML